MMRKSFVAAVAALLGPVAFLALPSRAHAGTILSTVEVRSS